MVKNILVAMDDSPHSRTARRYAVDLARGYGAVVKTLSVGDVRVAAAPGSWEYGVFSHVPSAWISAPAGDATTREEFVERSCRDLLAGARTKFETEGVPHRAFYRQGVPADVIVEEARTADLVIVGHRGEGTLFIGVTIGSTASSVARRANKPVFIAPRGHRPLARLLLAYDGSRHADHALSWAADLATTFELPIVMLSVHKYRCEAEARAVKAQEYLRVYPVRVETVLKRGDVTDAILSTAAEQDCHLIVMGAYGHSPVREVLLGSTTEEVMTYTAVPLLLVK